MKLEPSGPATDAQLRLNNHDTDLKDLFSLFLPSFFPVFSRCVITDKCARFAGLGFRPMPTDDNVESTLIHFKHGTAGNWKHWTTELEKFLHRKLQLVSLIDWRNDSIEAETNSSHIISNEPKESLTLIIHFPSLAFDQPMKTLRNVSRLITQF